MGDAPTIAITTSMWTGGSHGLLGVQLNTAYINAVQTLDAVAVLLTPAHGDDQVRALMALCDGILLSGGEDVDPGHYGEEPHPALGEVNPERDRMELTATAEALRLGMPILAVCRGIQLLNVARGGTLWQDIPSQLGGDLLHEQTAPVADRWHAATVEAGSRLAGIFGATELSINSFHHQAIRELGEGLRATARAEDGVIEGVEGTGPEWLVGVQWHPERGEAHGPSGDPRDPDRRLFWSFVAAASAYRR
jgi:putative glutamine amidotransferase